MAKKKRSRFKGKVAANAQKQRTAGSSYGHLRLPKGISMFKEDPGGRAFLDIIPYPVTDENHIDRDEDTNCAIANDEEYDLWYKKPYHLHRDVGVENDSVVCPTTFGKRCPICEYKAKRLKEGVEYEEVKHLRPSLRNLYAVIPVGMKKWEEKIHLWDISQFCFQDMLGNELEEDEAYESFPELEDGLTLKIRFSEEKIGKNSFAKTSRIDFKDRKEQHDESILDEVPNLDEVLITMEYDALEAKFFEMESGNEGVETEDEQEEEETPKPKRKTKTTKKKVKEEEPEENETYEDETDEDEEDGGYEEKAAEDKMKKKAKAKKEKPAAKKKKKGKEKDNPCPFGHVFGVDTDEFEDCDSCEEWDNCIEAQVDAE